MKLSTDHMEIVFPAIELATHWHAGVYRKEPLPLKWFAKPTSFLPYITHSIEVMKTVWKWRAGDPIMLCAAVCHDLLEDTKCPRELIAALHPQVLQLVEELTFEVDETLDAKVKAALKQEYMEAFKNKSPEALVLKCADRLKNTWDFAINSPKYAAKYLDKGLPVFTAVIDRGPEIIERFNTFTFDSIVNDHGELQEILNSTPLFGPETGRMPR